MPIKVINFFTNKYNWVEEFFPFPELFYFPNESLTADAYNDHTLKYFLYTLWTNDNKIKKMHVEIFFRSFAMCSYITVNTTLS